MFRYCPYYKEQKWKMRRNKIIYADIAAVLYYSPHYVNKFMHFPEKPALVQQVDRAIDTIIQQRYNGQPNNTPAMIEFNTDVREKLRELHISQTELAAVIGIKPLTLTMRLGRPLSDNTRRQIARAINTVMASRENVEAKQEE